MRTRISLGLCATLVLLSLLSPVVTQAQDESVCARPTIVSAGDTLTGLADTYLDDPLAFTRIIAATNAAAAVDDSYATIDDEGRIVIGWKLCLEAPLGEGGPTSAAPATAPNTVTSTTTGADAAANDVFTFDGERLTIDYLRGLNYPGSDIVVEETLVRAPTTTAMWYRSRQRG